jgi:hypothetical protein
MHITIEIDDGQERTRVTLPSRSAGAVEAASPQATPDVGQAIDAGPAPDVFGVASGSPEGPAGARLGEDAGPAPDML